MLTVSVLFLLLVGTLAAYGPRPEMAPKEPSGPYVIGPHGEVWLEHCERVDEGGGRHVRCTFWR